MFSKSRKTSISIVLSLFIIPILIITSITFVKPVYAQMMPMGMGMMPMGMGMMPMGMGMMPMGMGMMPMGMGMMPMGMGMMPMGMGMMPMGMGGGMMPMGGMGGGMMGGMGGGMMGGMGGGMMGGMGGGMMGGGMIPNIGGGMGGGIPGGGNPTSNFGNPGGPSGLPSLGGGDGGPLPQGQPCQPNAQNTVTAKDGTVWLSPTCTNQHIAQGCNVGQDSKPNPPYLTHLARGSSNDAVDFESPQGCGAPVYAPVDAVYTTINTAVGSTCQFSTSSGVYWLIHLKSVAGCNGPKRQGEIIGSNGCRGLEGMNGKGGPCHVHLSPPLPGAGYNPFCEIAKNPAPWIDQTDGCFYGGGTTTAGTGGTSGGSGGVGGGDENWRDIVSGAQGLMGQQKWAGGNGTDIFVRRGTQVRAPISGRVSFNSVPGGPMPIGEMIITNPDGRTVRFRHVQPIVSSGNVQLGQPVATVNDASMDMLRWPGGQYGNPPDGYQHLDLSLASNPGGLNPEGGQGGNVNAVQHIQSKGGIPNMQFVARTPGPPEGMSGGMMGGMMGGGMMPMGGGMMPMGGMMGGMPFGGI